MLNIVYSKAGNSKTNFVNNILASLAREGCEDLLLIVPEQFSFSAEREMLRLLGPVDCNRVEVVMSFSHIAETVRREYGSVRLREIGSTEKILLMSMAINSVKDKLGFFKTRAGSKSFIKDMLSLCDEFKQNALSAKTALEFSENVQSNTLKKKLEETSLIIEAYNALTANRFSDPFDTLTRLYEVLGEYSFFENKTVVIDGFHSFSRQELKIIERIVSQAENVYITACTDKVNSDDEYDIFAYTRKTVKTVINIAKRYNKQVKLINAEDKTGEEKELSFLRENIFRADKKSSENKPEKIKIISAKNIESEARFVALTVKKLLSEGNIRARDIAIVSRDGNEYDTEIKEALKKYSVEVFSDKLQPVKIQPLCTYVLSVLQICVFGMTSERIMKCLKTGLTDLTTNEIARLENYSLMWGNGADFSRVWTENPRGFGEELLENDVNELNELNRLREIAVKPIINFKKKISDSVSSKQASEEIYNLLISANVDKNLKNIAIELEESGENESALLQERIWQILIEILDSFACVAGEEKRKISDIYDLFDEIISSVEIGVLPQGLDEVLVGNAERTRVASPKIVFIVGANDGVFPRTPAPGGIFTHRERNILLEGGLDINVSVLDRIMEERFIAYNTMSSAAERLYVSYVTDSLSGEMYPSEIVNEIKSVYPETEVIDAESDDIYEYIFSPFTAFEAACSTISDKTEKAEILKALFESDEQYADRMKAIESYALDDLRENKKIRIENRETAEKLYGKNMRVSASRIETFYKCPFEYFCKFGLRAQPREKAEISPRQRGTVVHYCLEKLIREYGINELSQLSENELKKIIDFMLEEYAEIAMGGKENKTERFAYLFSKFQKTVFELIVQIIEEFSVSEFVPVGFELKIDADGEIPLYEIDLTDGGKISVRGSVDRVDIMQKGDKKYLRVVDYKTGGKDFRLNEVLAGINMQMLIYLFATTQNGTGIYENCTPAGVLYKPAKFGQISAERYEDEDSLVKKRKKEGKYSGLVLMNEDVIYGMDKEASGDIINVTVDDKNDKIEFKGSLISLAHLGKLKREVDKVIAEMGESLHAGNAEILPFEGKDSHACRYCDYKTVCNKKDDDKTRSPEDLKNEDIYKFFDREDEQNG